MAMYPRFSRLFHVVPYKAPMLLLTQWRPHMRFSIMLSMLLHNYLYNKLFLVHKASEIWFARRSHQLIHSTTLRLTLSSRPQVILSCLLTIRTNVY